MAETEEEEGRRERSPNYPAIGFAEALGLARKVYEKEKTHGLSRELAVTHMGYTLNGRSKQLLSALKKFGLLEDAPEGVRISKLAATALVLPASNPAQQSAIRELAMKPALFSRVEEMFPGELPSDENVVGRLMLDLNFTESAAKTALAVMKESLAVARASPLNEAEKAPATSPVTNTTSSVRANENSVSDRSVLHSSAQTPSAKGVVWDLGGGVQVTVSFSDRPSAKQLKMLKKYVEVMEEAEFGPDL